MAGSLRVQGAIATLSGGTLTIPTGAIIDGDVNAQADISVGKLRHLHKAGTNFDLGITGTPGSREELVYVATSAGTIRAFSAMLNDTGTSTDIDFTLKKNGVSIMTADINITNYLKLSRASFSPVYTSKILSSFVIFKTANGSFTLEKSFILPPFKASSLAKKINVAITREERNPTFERSIIKSFLSLFKRSFSCFLLIFSINKDLKVFIE